ncbi:hypothetical protein [Planktotalea sp.]|uniref:hypothetical protein n=1 Tax=Planktotalea sp. TaxID=2029877 RepID=UPI003D6B4153
MTARPSSANPAIFSTSARSDQPRLFETITRDFPKPSKTAIHIDIILRVGIFVAVGIALLANSFGLISKEPMIGPFLTVSLFLLAAWIGSGTNFEIAQAAVKRPAWKFVLFFVLAHGLQRFFLPGLLPPTAFHLAIIAIATLLTVYMAWGAITLLRDVDGTQVSRQIKAYLKTLPRSKRNASERQIRLQMITRPAYKAP